MAAGGSTRAIVAALFANLGIAIAKFVGFLLTSASSMLAEAIHSLADTGNQGLLLLGGRRARREPTARHPFGYGRERYFWAFIVSVVLFALGSLFALYEGVEKLRHPHELVSPQIAAGILAVGIVLELLVAGKVQLADDLGFDEVVTAIDEAERRVREAVPIARVIYLEPDHAPTGPTDRRAQAGGADHGG